MYFTEKDEEDNSFLHPQRGKALVEVTETCVFAGREIILDLILKVDFIRNGDEVNDIHISDLFLKKSFPVSVLSPLYTLFESFREILNDSLYSSAGQGSLEYKISEKIYSQDEEDV